MEKARHIHLLAIDDPSVRWLRISELIVTDAMNTPEGEQDNGRCGR
jgi:hypothetical protein